MPSIYTDGPFTTSIPRPYPDHAILLSQVGIITNGKYIDRIFAFESVPDWRMLADMGKPEDIIAQVVMSEMPQGSETHAKMKKKVEVEMGITSGRGYTYPFLVKCIANAIKPFYLEKNLA
jgi:hypothetical protein